MSKLVRAPFLWYTIGIRTARVALFLVWMGEGMSECDEPYMIGDTVRLTADLEYGDGAQFVFLPKGRTATVISVVLDSHDRAEYEIETGGISYIVPRGFDSMELVRA